MNVLQNKSDCGNSSVVSLNKAEQLYMRIIVPIKQLGNQISANYAICVLYFQSLM